jgi:GNAT superfamily N-acetyltransferase
MIHLIHTDSSHPDFTSLVRLLDLELKVRDGEDHAFYAQFNKVDTIRHVVIAYADEVAAGCGALKPYTTDTMEIKRMYTLDDYRGLGIASNILAALEAWAVELGYQRCILETGLNQPEAIGLYYKNGFTRIPNYGQYAGVESSVCFEKRLG